VKLPRATSPRRAKRAPRLKGAAPLLAAFHTVRILHYTAAEPVRLSSILERLRAHGCPIDATALNRTLVHVARNGWLRRTRHRDTGGLALPAYTLTSKGRQALRLARKRLKDLTRVLGGR